jgi:hypothetical protein
MKTKRTGGRAAVPKRIREQFPHVTKARDATETIMINVTKRDTTTGRKKDPGACALAHACVREKIADAAVIGLGYSWLINGNVATRYKTSAAVGREITSFDRHQDFAEGQDYKLCRVSPGNRMGRDRSRPRNSGPRLTTKQDTSHVHHTSNVRVIRRYR